LLIGGDFFNLDFMSVYAQAIPPPSWKEERETAKELLHVWLETFDEVALLMGNHDRRMQRFTAGELDEDDLIALVMANPQKVRMSRFGYCTIQSHGHNWRITHPKNYSINKLTVAEDLANKYNTNVISFHEHHLGIARSRYGQWLLVNGGSLVDYEQVPYMALDDSKTATSKTGFILLKSGVPYLFGEPPLTDWEKWKINLPNLLT
jgi:hypothetical protein